MYMVRTIPISKSKHNEETGYAKGRKPRLSRYLLIFCNKKRDSRQYKENVYLGKSLDFERSVILALKSN